MPKEVYYLSDTDVPEPIQFLRDIKIVHKRRVWWRFMKKYNIQSVCEVGVFESQNFRRMIESGPKIAVGVDLWMRDGNPAVNDSDFSQGKLEEQYHYFLSIMKENPFVRLCRQYSVDAAKNFPDEYFDLIYIDGDHTYEGCKQDLEAWWPKVKRGGFFTGDDYSDRLAPRTGIEFGVIKAVNEFGKINNLPIYELTRYGWVIIKQL